MKTKVTQLTLTMLAVIITSPTPSAQACTRVFLNRDPARMVVGRSFDLYREDSPKIVFFPKGVARSGAALPEAVKWTSKYASVGVTSFDACNSDGMNEKGLGAHLLYLDGSKYPAGDGKKPVLANMAWAQYVLDNFETVKEALAGLEKVEIISRQAIGRDWPLHLSMEDATGDSVVIECVDEKLVVHHGKEFTVMGNEPAFDVQLANRKKYKLFGGDLPMPGDIDPLSRFVRASSYLKTLPDPKNSDEAVAFVGGVMRTCMIPYGAEDTSGGGGEDKWPTLWVTLADLSNKHFYFLSTRSPGVVWVDLNKLAAGTEMLAISPNPELGGDITSQLTRFTPEQKEYPPVP